MTRPNTDPGITEIADKLAAAEEKKAEAAGEIKDLKAKAKDDGYDLKLLGQIVKEKRKGPKYQAQQLLFEMELTTYRAGYGLPTTAEEAQALARREADGEDDETPRKGGRREERLQ